MGRHRFSTGRSNFTISLGGVIEAPGVNLEGGKVGNVVYNTMNLFVGCCVNVGEKPVVHDIGLDPPSQSQSSVSLDEINEVSLRIADSSGCTLQRVLLSAFLSFGSGAISLNREAQDVNCTLECSGGVREITLPQGVLLGQLARKEAVSMREDSAVFANLSSYYL